jgi:hypothetical protein
VSVADLHRARPAGRSQSDRPPLWTIGLSALLIALGFGRRPSEAPSSPKGERQPFDDGRGRSARRPSEIPPPGWKDIVVRVYEGISEDRILANAAAVTFYALLALFPASRLWCRFMGCSPIRGQSPASSTRCPASSRVAPSMSFATN